MRPTQDSIRSLTAAVLLVTAGFSAAAAELPIRVRYRSADTAYLDAGAAVGLQIGDRLEVLRNDTAIAGLEIIYAAEHSASCRILWEKESIREGDEVRREGGTEPAAPAQSPTRPSAIEPDEVGTESSPPHGVDIEPAALPPVAAAASEQTRTTRVNGSISFDWDSFSDDSEHGYDADRSTARFKVRVRDIAGSRWQFRLRGRAQRYERTRAFANGAPESEERHRLYEAALIYEANDRRTTLHLGRIGVNPFVGIGYLDGALGSFRLNKTVDVGAFFGSRPAIDELGFESIGQKYGLFARFGSKPPADGARSQFELFVAGIREDGEIDVSREYVTVETRYAPGDRWIFFQRAELDLNNGWRRDLDGDSSQLSFFSLGASGRLSPTARLHVSYDRFERYRSEETRDIPEELFDDLLRQGLRLRLLLGKPGRLTYTVHAGMRDRDDDDDNTFSYGVGVRHPRAFWNVGVSTDLLGFSNRLTEGLMLTTRAAKTLAGGHQIYLTLGGQQHQNKQFPDMENRTTTWARLGGWLELTDALSANFEYELSTGDDLEGQRVRLGLGYRF